MIMAPVMKELCSEWNSPFHHKVFDYSPTDQDGYRDHIGCSVEDIFNLVTLAATSEFCEWVQIGTDVYIPHRKFQVRPHSSLWFPFVCLAVIADKTEHIKKVTLAKSS